MGQAGSSWTRRAAQGASGSQEATDHTPGRTAHEQWALLPRRLAADSADIGGVQKGMQEHTRMLFLEGMRKGDLTYFFGTRD